MEKGIKMTIKISQDILKKMTQDDENRPEIVLFDEENDTCITHENESD